MKSLSAVLGSIALVLSTSVAFAGGLPEEPGMGLIAPPGPIVPQKQPGLLRRIPAIDYSLGTALIGSHVADWMTTEKCLHTSQQQEKAGYPGICHEGLLPQALVENKVGFGFYEAGTAGAELYAQYMLEKRHHTRIARIVQLANIAGTAFVVAHNYHMVDVAAHTY